MRTPSAGPNQNVRGYGYCCDRSIIYEFPYNTIFFFFFCSYSFEYLTFWIIQSFQSSFLSQPLNPYNNIISYYINVISPTNF